MLQRQYSDKELKRNLDLAISGIDQANSIIGDYLLMAKPRAQETCELDIQEEIAGIVRFIDPLATENNIEIMVQHTSIHPLFIIGERKKLWQCIINLIKNAIESIPQSGTITIKTIRLNKNVYIEIKDTGSGMTQAQIKSLGVPYYTTKEQGTGLGLVVVFSLITEMNGRISFTSQIGSGTSCLLEFKLSPSN